MGRRYSDEVPLVGIDYGSKLAGTTAVAVLFENQLTVSSSQKKRDADLFIEQQLAAYPPGLVAIDAPLSLPGVYTGISGCTDYHYRACDRELRAMSPMFLGGLTARAMRQSSSLRQNGWDLREAYPAVLVRKLALASYSKKDKLSIKPAQAELAAHWGADAGLVSALLLNTYHELDALLALTTARRIVEGSAAEVGGADGGVWV